MVQASEVVGMNTRTNLVGQCLFEVLSLLRSAFFGKRFFLRCLKKDKEFLEVLPLQVTKIVQHLVHNPQETQCFFSNTSARKVFKFCKCMADSGAAIMSA